MPKADDILEGLEGSLDVVGNARLVLSNYQAAHSRVPRGYGRWAFGIGSASPTLSNVVWKHGLWSAVRGEILAQYPDEFIYVLA